MAKGAVGLTNHPSAPHDSVSYNKTLRQVSGFVSYLQMIKICTSSFPSPPGPVSQFVMPAEAGIQSVESDDIFEYLDSRFRGN